MNLDTHTQSRPTPDLDPVDDGREADADLGRPIDGDRTGGRMPIAGAVVATVAVGAALAAFLLRPAVADDELPTVAAPTASSVVTTQPTSVPHIEPEPTIPVEVAPTVPSIGLVPVPTVAPSDDASPTVVEVPPSPPIGDTSPPPPPPPPAPAPVLHVQPTYTLDPGVHGVTVSLGNTGDAALAYNLTNVGDGYSTASPSGEIESDGTVDVWLDLDVSADDVGPTLFERVVNVASNGGNATITITGQVEKPGFVVADHASLPLVDYRATVSFTNVGALPVTVTDVEAPGFTYGPLPDQVAAGESFTIDVAICIGDADSLPIFANVPIPGHALPGFLYGGEFAVATVEGSASVELTAQSAQFAPPTCEPVVVTPIDDVTLAP